MYDPMIVQKRFAVPKYVAEYLFEGDFYEKEKVKFCWNTGAICSVLWNVFFHEA